MSAIRQAPEERQESSHRCKKKKRAGEPPEWVKGW